MVLRGKDHGTIWSGEALSVPLPLLLLQRLREVREEDECNAPGTKGRTVNPRSGLTKGSHKTPTRTRRWTRVADARVGCFSRELLASKRLGEPLWYSSSGTFLEDEESFSQKVMSDSHE